MSFVRKLLGEQRKRVVASVLTSIESHVNGRLNDEEMADLRRQVLGALNGYHDTCLDILKSSVNDGMEVNEEALRLIADFNNNVHWFKQRNG